MKTGKLTMRGRERAQGYAFVSIYLIGFIVFFVVPFIVSIVYTFTFGTSGTNFVGIDNYVRVIKSTAFQLAAYNTGRFLLFGVPLIMVISTVLALLLQSRFGGSSVFRSIFLYPMVVPIASTVMVFQVILANSGILNTILAKFEIYGIRWIDSDYAFYVMLFLYLWKNCGYNIVLILSGLNAIPSDFYEVARLEGANSVKQFRYITLPIMMPTFFFVFIISIVNSFKSFREAYLLSGTLPDDSIYMLQHYMNNNFSNLNYQNLSVAAFMVFLVIFTCVFVLFRMRSKSGDYEL